MAMFYINYATDCGEAPEKVSVDVTDGASFAFTEDHLPTLSADGYKFEGWLFAGALISAGYTIDEVDEDIAFTLIAKWSKENSICGNAAGAFGFPKTYIITDENGNELTGVYVESETIFTATDNDVRENMVYASDNGVSTGTKVIPSYHTRKGSKLVLPSTNYSISLSSLNLYDYTKLQCMIAKHNTSFTDSVSVNKVVLEDNVYEVNSTEILSQVTKNDETKSIDLNIVNNTEDIYVIHYFTYREEY